MKQAQLEWWSSLYVFTTEDRCETGWMIVFTAEHTKRSVSSHLCLLFTSYFVKHLSGTIADSFLFSAPFPSSSCVCSAYLSVWSASTLWPSQLCLIRLSPPSLPVPMLLSLCLPRLTFSQPLTNHFSLSLSFSLAWLDKLAFAVASVLLFFQSLLQMVDLLMSVHWVEYMSCTSISVVLQTCTVN